MRDDALGGRLGRMGILCALLAAAGTLLGGCPTGGGNNNNNENDNNGGGGGGGGGSGGATCAPVEPTTAATVSFANDVEPILSGNGCLSCHARALPSSGYDLRSYDSMFDPGNEARDLDACPIVPGDPDASYLFEKIAGQPRQGLRMPFFGAPLSDDEIATIRTWIEEGAQDN